MNHIFAPYIGDFMDSYLDDMYIYSDTLEDHIRHCKLVLDVLKREKLYISEKKMKFLVREVNVLGHIVDENGIRMDPAKVDSVLKWKTPTNRDLLRGFLGAVGFLADDAEGIRIPMGVLSSLTGDTVPFRWEYTHQRAFEDVKSKIQAWREHRRKPLQYGKDAPQIWLITDASVTGISGVVAQGNDWKTAEVAAFYSAKLDSAQQNYAVHELELFAGVESMLRHRDILQGAKFKWLTDHKGLTHILTQPNLTGRQARWIEKISEFDFEPVYIPGVENVLSDALSRIYSNDKDGTVRARSEYSYHDVVEGKHDPTMISSIPMYVGTEALMASLPVSAVSNDLPVEDVTVGAAGVASRAKTSAEFAKRIGRKGFVLHGPREQKEGGSRDDSAIPTPAAQPAKKKRRSKSVPGSSKIDLRKSDNTATPNLDPGTSQNAENASHTAPSGPPNESFNPPPFSFADMVRESDSGIDLTKELKGKYSEDTVFKAIIDKPSEYRNFELKDGLVYLKIGDQRRLCIPRATYKGRSVREIVIAEAHTTLAHLGHKKTLDYLRDHVWWKEMAQDTQKYCESCMRCKRSKPNNQRPYGLLNPMPVPTRPWEAIGMDFVGPLPESRDRNASYDSITVIIDLLSAMVHLVPSRTNYSAIHVAELLFDRVYRLHGLPMVIVSDRDVWFTSRFWQRLHDLIGTELKMSSAYHPQTDGATERANRTITQMLRQCISPSQRDWVTRLPAIEFAVNMAKSGSTGYSPFFLNYGRLPRSLIWKQPPSNEYPGVREFAERVRLAVISAHDSILAARVKQTRDANNRRRPAPFEVGDLVYVSTENLKFPQGLARKLLPKFVGPYKIVKHKGGDTFAIELPARLVRRGINNAFHSNLLRIHIPNDDRLFPNRLDDPLFEINDDDLEWAADEILSHSGRGPESLFELRWRSGDVTWLPYHQISQLHALQSYLDLHGVLDIKDLPSGKGTPPADFEIALT
ncbi:hypothetical protein ONZ45_g13670 [Pleurotus djamor]|nr:hypothetical protein ONZ45_g13670 [Pleurotus djamor]